MSDTQYGRLQPRFVSELASNPPEPMAEKGYISHFKKCGFRGSVQRYWQPMLAGNPVEWKYIKCFVDYLNQCCNQSICIDSVATVSDAPAIDATIPELWSGGWSTVGRILAIMTPIPSQAYCNSADDYQEAATILLTSAGRKAKADRPNELATLSDLAAGELIYQRTRLEYGTWLQQLCEADKHKRPLLFSVLTPELFGVDRPVRVGATFILPLRKQAAQMFMSGRLSELDFTPDHIEIPSPYIYYANVAEVPREQYSPSKLISYAQWHTGFYQSSVMCPFLKGSKASRPFYIGAPPHTAGRARAKAFGFTETAFRDPRRPCTIFTLVPQASFNYIASYALMTLFQLAYHPDCHLFS